MANFVLELPLKTEKYQSDILDRRFETARILYNTLVSVTLKQYKEMTRTRRYIRLMNSLTGNTVADRPVWKQINTIRKEYGFSEYSFHNKMTKIRKHFSGAIDSATAQKIASAVWKAYEKMFYGNGEKVHYKKYDTVNSLEGKANKTGIRFKDGMLVWKTLRIPVMIEEDNFYETQALQHDICYCRIVRKYIRNRYRYYIQLVMKGTPPEKICRSTGVKKHSRGTGDVGLDIGTSTIAVSGENDVRITELADRVQNIEDRKRKLLRKMDRSRRATNPDNYNEDGTIRKQGNRKVTWKRSNHYIRYQNEMKELYRKQAAIRKEQHESLANYILSLGNKIYVEKMSFSGLQKRAKKTEKKEDGTFSKKKRFGKSIANRAPAMLLSILDRKLGYEGGSLTEINTTEARASQFNHIDGTYTKKPLSQRWNDIGGNRVQRDMYSAFLIMNIDSDLKSFDINKCNDRFSSFCLLHDNEVKRLQGKKNLRSIGI